LATLSRLRGIKDEVFSELDLDPLCPICPNLFLFLPSQQKVDGRGFGDITRRGGKVLLQTIGSQNDPGRDASLSDVDGWDD
jgi:hypothetical protein